MPADYVDYFTDERHRAVYEALLRELHIPEEKSTGEAQIFEGKSFVITGNVRHFANRNEVKALIEAKGEGDGQCFLEDGLSDQQQCRIIFLEEQEGKGTWDSDHF